eukprot:6214380-Pleurochrysis_carterae.AAC.1
MKVYFGTLGRVSVPFELLGGTHSSDTVPSNSAEHQRHRMPQKTAAACRRQVGPLHSTILTHSICLKTELGFSLYSYSTALKAAQLQACRSSHAIIYDPCGRHQYRCTYSRGATNRGSELCSRR